MFPIILFLPKQGAVAQSWHKLYILDKLFKFLLFFLCFLFWNWSFSSNFYVFFTEGLSIETNLKILFLTNHKLNKNKYHPHYVCLFIIL